MEFEHLKDLAEKTVVKEGKDLKPFDPEISFRSRWDGCEPTEHAATPASIPSASFGKDEIVFHPAAAHAVKDPVTERTAQLLSETARKRNEEHYTGDTPEQMSRWLKEGNRTSQAAPLEHSRPRSTHEDPPEQIRSWLGLPEGKRKGSK